MSAGREDFLRRFKSFAEQGYYVLPTSYQIRNADMTAGPWKAKAQIFKDEDSHTNVLSLFSTQSQPYVSKEGADNAGLWMALKWLELRAAKGQDPFAEPLEEGVSRDRYPFQTAVLKTLVEESGPPLQDR
jgi:hypothetical protein